jgi:3-oxoacyl-[acyl-carrier protein] reductase
MLIDMSGDIAIITGAGRGLGRGVAEEMAASGAKVALFDRDPIALADTAERISAAGGVAASYVVDVSDWLAVSAAVAQVHRDLGDPTVLVTAAAVDESVSIIDMPVESWQHMIDVNLSGTFYCLKATVPTMRRNGYGRVVLFGSQIALKGGADIAHYGAAKGGVHSLARCAALELAATGVTVNTIAPGPIDTDMLRSLPPEWLDNKKREMPVGRFGSVDEVVPAVVLLASRRSGFSTGSTVNVSGGDVMM